MESSRSFEAGALDLLERAGERLIAGTVDHEVSRHVPDWPTRRPSWLRVEPIAQPGAPLGVVLWAGLGPRERAAARIAGRIGGSVTKAVQRSTRSTGILDFACGQHRPGRYPALATVRASDPREHVGNLSISIEINPPYEGIDRRMGGVFLEQGSVLYLGHRANHVTRRDSVSPRQAAV